MYAKHVKAISNVLQKEFGDFAHYNLQNPFDELIFIILSTRTKETLYRSVYSNFKRSFRRRKDLISATAEELQGAISLGGLSNKKASQIKDIISICCETFGRPTLSPLHKLDDEACETFLLGLPGVGNKIARCVMMYSLDRQVFPVDVHCWRIATRLGWISSSRRNGSPSRYDEDSLQAIIPPALRYSLHVNMVSLGKACCTKRDPACSICPIEKRCIKRFADTGH